MRSFKTYFNKTKKAAFILCCLFLVSTQSYAQDQSKLYNNNRKLIADDTLVLSPAAYKIWRQVEDSIVNKVESILRYPPPFTENCITPNTIILSFTYAANGISQFHIEKAFNANGWKNEIAKNIQEAHIEQYFKNIRLKKNKTYSFYLPLKWKIRDTQPCNEYWQQTKKPEPLTAYKLAPVNTVKAIDKGWITTETNLKLQITQSDL